MRYDYVRPVLTINAPRGAITSEKHLRRHVRRRKPIYIMTVGHIAVKHPTASWTFNNCISLNGTWLLETYHRGSSYPGGKVIYGLPDAHIGNTHGYNDNWIFESLEAAKAYQARHYC